MFAVTLAGCQERTGGLPVIEHPIEDSLSVQVEDAVIVQNTLDAAPDEVLRLAARLDRRTSIAHVGVPDGEPEYVFGEVVDAMVLDDGSLAVLDGQAQVVRLFDAQGVHQATIGGPGEGPGEFQFPLALLDPRPGEFWVVDGAQMVHRFDRGPEGWGFSHRTHVEGFPKDACVTSDGMVVHVPARNPEYGPGEVLLRLDPDGEVQSRFSRPYRYGAPIVAHRMSRGFVSCTGHGTVLLGLEFQNRLDAYRVQDGSLDWHATFEGVVSPPTTEELRPDGSRAVQTDILRHLYSHVLLNVEGGGGVAVVVQFGRREASDVREGIDRLSIETYALDPLTGRGGYLGDDLLRILRLTEDHVVLLHMDPYPRVELARLPDVDP